MSCLCTSAAEMTLTVLEICLFLRDFLAAMRGWAEAGVNSTSPSSMLVVSPNLSNGRGGRLEAEEAEAEAEAEDKADE